MSTQQASISAERSMLGLAIRDPLVLDEYAGILADGDWYRPQHAALWRRLLAMREDAQHARSDSEAWMGAVLVEAFGWGQEVDGAAYVSGLISDSPASGHAAGYYARTLTAASLARSIRDAAALTVERIDHGADPAEVLAGYESAMAALSLRASVQASPWVTIGETAVQVYEETQEAVRNPESRIRRVVPTPWGWLNWYTRGGIRRGEVAILAGRPGTGKTAAAMQMAEHAALHGGVGVFSMEMTRQALTMRELAREGRVDLTAITRADLNREQWACLTQGVEVLNTRPIWIDDTPALHITQIRARAKRLRDIAARQGTELRTLVIDYVQLATATVSKGENEQAVLSRISQAMVAIAKELDVAVLALAQMNRAVEGRAGEKPKSSDLRGSGQLEQDAAVIVFTYRDPDTEIENARELIVTKARHGETGGIAMRWDGSIQTLTEAEPMQVQRPRLAEVPRDEGRWPDGER